MKRIIYTLHNHLTEGKHHIGFVRFFIRVFANMLIYLIGWLPISQQKESPMVIVSLTSFPARIKQLWKVIVLLLHQQTTVPFKVILWLSEEQFDGYESLPNRLKKLAQKGLEIKLMKDDLKSHKKYYYAFSEYTNHIVITVDDDILYSLNLIQALYEAHQQSPSMICCCRGRKAIFNIDGEALSYAKWEILSTALNDTISNAVVPTGIGGVLYPPQSFSKDIFNKSAFKSTCLNGDDLWLNFMCRQKGTCIKHIANQFRYITLFSSQKGSLSKSNVKLNKNDEQIKLISAWAKQHLNCDFFFRMQASNKFLYNMTKEENICS